MGRRFEHDIAFPTPFREPPVVFLSITGLDHDNDNNLRFLTQVEHVSKSGFRAVCFTWDETLIYFVGITWLAFSPSFAITRVFYCGDSNSRSWLPDNGNPQYPEHVGKQYRAYFSTEMNYTPVILQSVTYLDVDRFHNLRFLAQVINISTSWFRATCYTWDDTRIFEMRVSLLILQVDSRGRMGEFYCGHSWNWDSVNFYGPGAKQSVHDVIFPVPFNQPPLIFLTVTYLDTYNDYNLRFLLRVLDVSVSGFSAACYTWSTTEIDEMRVTWLAV